jgi:hypothetical protein
LFTHHRQFIFWLSVVSTPSDHFAQGRQYPTIAPHGKERNGMRDENEKRSE